MTEPDALDLGPAEPVAAPAPKPADATIEPKLVIASAFAGLSETQARRVADQVVVALAAAGWWFVHDSEPGKKTGYRGRPQA